MTMNKKTDVIAIIKKWEFLYRNYTCDNGDKLRIKIYTAPTIEKAATKMVNFIERSGCDITVDYEARALHESDSKPHTVVYPNLTAIDHKINEYV